MNYSPEEQFARKIAARLDDACNDLPLDISAKLEARRNLALNYRKEAVISAQDSQVAISVNRAFYLGIFWMAILLVSIINIKNIQGYANYKADEKLDEPVAHIINNPQLSWTNFLNEVGADMENSPLED